MYTNLYIYILGPLAVFTLMIFIAIGIYINYLNYKYRATDLIISITYIILFIELLTYILIMLKNPGVANTGYSKILANSSNKPW